MWFVSENWVSDLAFFLLAMSAATAFWLAAHALFPKFIDQSSRRWQRPWRNLWLGLAICLPFFLLAHVVQIWMGQIEDRAHKHGDIHDFYKIVFGILGGGLTGALFLGALAGLAGLALRIGAGMKGAREDRHSWLVCLRGSVVLAAICGFLPVLNSFFIWVLSAGGLEKLGRAVVDKMYFFFIFVLLAGGLGNFIMILFRREPPRLGQARNVGSRIGRGESDREHSDRRSRPPRRARPPRSRDDQAASRRTTEAKGSDSSAGSP